MRITTSLSTAFALTPLSSTLLGTIAVAVWLLVSYSAHIRQRAKLVNR